MRITLTDAAIAHVTTRRRAETARGSVIRIINRAGRLRCRFGARPDRTDSIVEERGILVAVAAEAAPEVDGAILDVVETPEGARRLALRRRRPSRDVPADAPDETRTSSARGA